MSDRHEDQPPPVPQPETVESEAVPAPAPAPAPSAAGKNPRPGRTVVLVGALLIALIVAASGPLWTPLLPWGAGASTDRTLAARIDELMSRQQQVGQQVEQLRQQAGPAGRQAQAVRQQAEHDAAAAAAAVQQLAKRLDALEARPAVSPAETVGLRDQSTKLAGAVADLAARVAAIEKSARTQSARDTRDTTDMGLALVALQIRAALDTGRPFAAEYEALAKMAQNRPELMAAAEPLAAASKTGIATRTVLAKNLHEIGRAISATPEPASVAPDWTEAALGRLRGLVTIRRLDAAPASGPGAAVSAAETALARGDLSDAVAQLATLTEGAAEAAAPWLHMARARLAVENALHRLETSLATRLSETAATPAASTQ